jgi:Alanine dehydrogenase/PNT, N-terminal domain
MSKSKIIPRASAIKTQTTNIVIASEASNKEYRAILAPNEIKTLTSNKSLKLNIYFVPSQCRRFTNDEYTNAGAKPYAQARILEEDNNIVLSVKPLEKAQIEQLQPPRKTKFIAFMSVPAKPGTLEDTMKTIIKKSCVAVDIEKLVRADGLPALNTSDIAGVVGMHHAIYLGLVSVSAKSEKNILAKLYFGEKEMLDAHINASAPIIKKLTRTKILILGANTNAGKGAIRLAKYSKIGIEKYGTLDIFKTKLGYIDSKLISDDEKKQAIYGGERKYMYESRLAEILENFAKNKFNVVIIDCFKWTDKMPVLLDRADIPKAFNPNSSKYKKLSLNIVDVGVSGSMPCFNRYTDSMNAYPYTDIQSGAKVLQISNLPNSLAKDASIRTSIQFTKYVLPEILNGDENDMLKKAKV